MPEKLGITPNKTHGTKIYGRLRLEKRELCPAMGGRRSGTRTERGSITSSTGNSPTNFSPWGFNTKKIRDFIRKTLGVQHQKKQKGTSLREELQQSETKKRWINGHPFMKTYWLNVGFAAPGEHWRTIPKMRWSLRLPGFVGTGWIKLKPPWNPQRQDNHWESSSLFVDVKHDWNCQPNDVPDTGLPSPHDWLKLSCCLGKSPFLHPIQRVIYITTPDSARI